MALALSAVSALLLLPSCNKEEMEAPRIGKEIRYAVTCGSVQPSAEKKSSESGSGSVVASFELVSEDGSLSIPVSVIETDGLPGGSGAESEVKGYLINGPEGAVGYNGKPIALSDSLDTFIVHAFDTDTQKGFFAKRDSVATYTDGRWVMSKAYYWPQTKGIDFYAYANLPAQEGSASVKLDSLNRRQVLTYTVPGDTKDQTDILMAIYSGTGTANGEAEICFYHPLTAVQFSRADTPEMTGITNITMSGVHYKARATQTRDIPSVFTWDMLDSKTTTVVQDNDGKPFEVHGEIDGAPFLLIPQYSDGASKVQLSVTVVYNEHRVPINAVLNNMDWKPGKTYTYKIGYKGTLEVDFRLDKIESETMKKNAVVWNVGSKDCYVRATAVGYITDDEGTIKSTWLNDDGTNKGSFTVDSGTFGSTTGWNTNWVAGEDGFWYYKKPIKCSGADEAAKRTTPLFNQYSITGLASGELFEMVLSAEAVEWDSTKQYVKQTWGEAAAALLE